MKINEIVLNESHEEKLFNLKNEIESGNQPEIANAQAATHDYSMGDLEKLGWKSSDTAEIALVESFPTRIEGRQMIMVLAPKKK